MIRVNQPLNQPGLADNKQTNNQFSNQTNQFPSDQNQTFNPPNSFNQNFQNQPPKSQLLTPKGFFQLPENVLRMIPWIPIGLEMLTGQKIPPTGALADILDGIQQLQFSLAQLQVNQQHIYAKLENLENNASQQLTNLSQQVANTKQDFRVFATETKKSLEFHGDGKDLEQARKFIPQSKPEPNYNEPESEYQ